MEQIRTRACLERRFKLDVRVTTSLVWRDRIAPSRSFQVHTSGARLAHSVWRVDLPMNRQSYRLLSSDSKHSCSLSCVKRGRLPCVGQGSGHCRVGLEWLSDKDTGALARPVSLKITTGSSVHIGLRVFMSEIVGNGAQQGE
jgi:hypothetical protein